MKKLLFLILLIPILSWADSWGPKNKFESELSAKDLRLLNEIHTQVHKCYDESYFYSKKFPKRPKLAVTYACFCKTLGGPASHGRGVDCRGNDEFPNPRFFNLPWNHFTDVARYESNLNSAKTSSPKISATEAESQCSLMHISNKKNINKKGTLKYMDGKNFDGELDRYCIVEYEGGGKYIGNFKDSERHGQGVMTHPESGKFDGQWKNNWMLKGTMTYLSGDKYIGEFGGYGKLNGQGTYIKSNGDEYSGIWKDGYNENFANNLPTKKASQNITTTPTTPTTSKTSITDAKSQCSDIGFKAGTEKFGDCVLELMQ